MKGRRRTTIFRPGLMSNLIIYYKLINYKCMDNIMKCTPLGEQNHYGYENIVNYEILCSFSIIGNYPVLGRCRLFTECEDVFGYGKYYGA